MKKKRKLGYYIRRILLVTIVVLVGIFAGIYFLDVYKISSSSANNKYSDDYFNNLKENGFIEYDDLIKETNLYNYNASEYVDPFISNPQNLEGKLTNQARYQEEVLKYLRTSNNVDFSIRVTQLETEINNVRNVYNGTINQWVLQLIGVVINPTTEVNVYNELVNLGYQGTYEDFLALCSVEANYQNGLLQELNKEKDLITIERLCSLLLADSLRGNDSIYQAAKNSGLSAETAEEWVLLILGLISNQSLDAYENFKSQGYLGNVDAFKKDVLSNFNEEAFYAMQDQYYTGSKYDFAYFLRNDGGTAGGQSAYFMVTNIDVDLEAELIAEKREIERYLDLYNELPSWSDYLKNNLGYGNFPETPDLENANYRFYFDKINTTFKIEEKNGSNVWYSNPQGINSNDVSYKTLMTILNVYIGKTTGNASSYSNFEYAVTDKSALNLDIKPDYMVNIKKAENILQVYYHLSNRERDYRSFPKYMSIEFVDELLARNQFRYDNADIVNGRRYYEGVEVQLITPSIKNTWLNADIYSRVPVDEPTNEFGYEYYAYKGNIKNMSGVTVRRLLQWMYDWCGFTEEDLESENDKFLYEVEEVLNIDLKIVIEYELTEQGLQVRLPGNSITDNVENVIYSVDVLPYFTTTEKGIEGYTVIPDGSGAVMNHDNGKTSYPSYSKRVYTTDLAKSSPLKTADIEQLLFPMYAVVNNGNNTGVLVEALQAAAQMELKADTSGRQTGIRGNYNRSYYTVYLRETQSVKIGTWGAIYINKFTTDRVKEDVVLGYTFLKPDELNYSSVAKKYRQILIDRYGLDENDTTDKPVLDLDIIGSYSFRNNFAGIGYNDMDTLTTYQQLQAMINEYLAINVAYVNVFYHGWRDKALVDYSFEKFKLNKDLGNPSELRDFVNNHDNVNFYPYISLGEVNNYQESFGRNHYNVRNVIGEIIERYPYDINSGVYDTTKKQINTISPRYYEAFTRSLVDSYAKIFGSKARAKKQININSLSIDNFGSVLTGDYKRKNTAFKTNAVEFQKSSFQYMIDNGITDINLYTPYDYAFEYLTHAKNIPYQASQYEILDYDIPFYQLVVNGLFDYSGESINENSKRSTKSHVMKMLETGTNPAFTFTYDSTEKLTKTDYNYYNYTYYKDWLSTVEDVYNELLALRIFECQLISHERVANKIYKVIYQGNNFKVEIYLNYSQNEEIVPGTSLSIKANDYIFNII